MISVPRISIVMATHNRRDVVLTTLQRLFALGPVMSQYEIIVVDNASEDGTAGAITDRFSRVRLVELEENLGSCAKAFGADRASGDYIVFLDDDSYPRPGSLERMVARFEADSDLAAAGFVVHLPDGRCESAALPHVFVGCGVGFVRDALEAVGGLDRTLFMQAEEYDLSFRFAGAGYNVATFGDLHVDHLKSPTARIGERTVYYDTRNNLLLAARYLPDEYEAIFRDDWACRYGWIASQVGHGAAYDKGKRDAQQRRSSERAAYADRRLSPAVFEKLFRFDHIDQRIARLARDGISRVVLAGVGKNIYPFVRSAKEAGLDVLCIADDRFATDRFAPGQATDDTRCYRGIPIRTTADALAQAPDAIVVSDTSPVHAAATQQRLTGQTKTPIHRWFGYDVFDEAGGCVCPILAKQG